VMAEERFTAHRPAEENTPYLLPIPSHFTFPALYGMIVSICFINKLCFDVP